MWVYVCLARFLVLYIEFICVYSGVVCAFLWVSVSFCVVM